MISDRKLIIGSGLAGVGKTTYLQALSQKIANSIYIDKDLINLVLLQGHSYTSDH